MQNADRYFDAILGCRHAPAFCGAAVASLSAFLAAGMLVLGSFTAASRQVSAQFMSSCNAAGRHLDISFREAENSAMAACCGIGIADIDT